MSRFFIDRLDLCLQVITLDSHHARGGASRSQNLHDRAVPESLRAAGDQRHHILSRHASAKTIEDTVTQVIEQQLNGIDNLRYIEAESTSAGDT